MINDLLSHTQLGKNKIIWFDGVMINNFLDGCEGVRISIFPVNSIDNTGYCLKVVSKLIKHINLNIQLK